jgi:phosphoribosylanthranilate isomerase
VARVIVKICGLSTAPTLEAAIGAGADMAGFVFHEKSPRHIGLGAARGLGALAAGRIKKVALTVDADDDALDAVVEALSADYLQLHGSESPARVEAVKARFGLPVIKAIGVADKDDAREAADFAGADIILFDAKPAPGAALPGGNGLPFDWLLLQDVAADRPWLLSGGLDASNVGEALRMTGAPGVDVSSGVESARGVKDVARILAFARAARALSSPAPKV